MRLIIEYDVTDGCTFSCTNTFPLEYESAEQLLVDIEHNVAEYVIWNAQREKEFDFVIGDADFATKYVELVKKYPYTSPTMQIKDRILWLSHFLEDGVFVPPYIYTVDEWFSKP
jgi:hypothetical protein